jgi:PAS domain S-box-containing protein
LDCSCHFLNFVGAKVFMRWYSRWFHRWFMRAPDKSERKILFSVLSILIILCSLAYFSHRNSQQLIRSSEEVEHSQEVKYNIEKIIAVSTDLTSGARGYVLSGDEHFLEPTNKSIAVLFGYTEQLKKTLKDNSKELAYVGNLEKAIDDKISFTNRLVEIRQNKGADDAFAFFSTGKDKQLLDNIKNISVQIMRDEEANLVTQKRENQTNISHFNLAFGIFLLKIAITIFSVFFLLRFYFRERTRAAVTLKENKELLQTVINNAPSFVFVKDLQGRYILANEHYEEQFDLPSQEMIGRTDHAIFPKEIADIQRGGDLEAIKEKQPIEMEETLPLGGTTKHYLSIKFPLFDKDNFIYAVGGIATDITERKQFEKLLKRRSDEVLDLFNNAPCGYHSINKDLVINEMNDTELAWLGYNRSEVIGKMNIYDIYSAESGKLLERMSPELVKQRTATLQDVEVRCKRKDGTTFPVLINSVILYDEKGEFFQSKTALFDITLRKKAESIIAQN